MNLHLRTKLGDWILDVAKYLLTAGILAPMLHFGDVESTMYYVVVIVVVVVMLALGFYFIDDDESNNNNKRKNRRNKNGLH